MRRIYILCTLLAVVLIGAGCTIQYYEDPDAYTDSYDDEYYYEDEVYADDIAFAEFDDLQFWGQWVDLYPYGTVWRPTVVMGWRPFEHGHWVWTEWGWTWVSYEPFGWATYHYGYWAYDIVWGWVWIPGYDWTPACVDWVIYDDYIAWAPRPADGFRIGDPWTVKEVYVWHVVAAGDFTRPDIGRYHVGYKENYRVRTRSTVRYKSPQVDYVELRTNGVVKPVQVSLVDRTVGERTIKQLRLPDTEARRVERYRDDIDKKIRDTDPPTERRTREREPRQDDRIVPKRTDRDTDSERREPPTRKKKPTRKEPAKKDDGNSKPRKQDPDTPKAKQPDRPAKQEPDKSKEQPKKKDTGKRKPKKKRG